jgi:amino acid adenylation domain-containing protein
MSDIVNRIAGLSPQKQEMLRRRLEQQRGQTLPATPTRQARPAGAVPLSFAQLRLWLLEQFHPGTATYNIQRAFRVQGALNIASLIMAVAEVMRRHEVLRTTFEVVDGQPTQKIAETATLPLTILDMRDMQMDVHAAGVLRAIREAEEQPFDLVNGPLWRIGVLTLDNTEQVLCLSMHHIVSDGWSIGIVIRELLALYAAQEGGQPAPLAELPIQYADFAIWQRQWLETGDVLERQLSYWRQQLANAPTAIDLPTDFPRPSVQTFKGATEALNLPLDLAYSLTTLSQQENATLFMTLLGGFQTLLFRTTGQDDVLVGSPVANRRWAETEGLIGFFANTLVFRGDLAGNPSFRELLGRVRTRCLEAYANQDVPFEKVVEALQPQRELSRTPLFQVMFALQNIPLAVDETTRLNFGPYPLPNTTAKFDLTLYMDETPGGITTLLEFNTDLFERDTARRLLNSFEILLRGIVENPNQTLLELPCISAADKQQVLADWNQTQSTRSELCLHELFEAQAQKTPDLPAAADKTQTLTYAELDAQANQLAHYLRRQGVGDESLVVVCAERSVMMVVDVLAVLKAGGAYVALDPSYPAERNKFILAEVARTSAMPVVLTQAHLVEQLALPGARVVCVDRLHEAIAAESTVRLETWRDAEQLAYVLYTSGSTGLPKGVALSHRGAVALMDWARGAYSAEERSAILASTSLCFDLSVFELFVPLSWGGMTVVVETVLDFLKPDMPKHPLSLINTVPSAMEELVQAKAVPATVQTINLAGEPLTQALAARLYEIKTVQAVYNLYGPSEDTTYSTFARIERLNEMKPAIGKPIANTQTYVLDAAMQPVPIGVAGDLYIGGLGLARCYQNQPDLTAERFVPNPFSDEAGCRLYRTGDLARYRANGDLDFLGRLDQQVKIRGYRIELGEIESVLCQNPLVQTAVVLARVASLTRNDKRLVAYLVRATETAAPLGEKVATTDVRQFLESRLPGYMLPAALVWLDKLPLTPNGKVDRRALPDPDWARPTLATTFLAPSSPLEQEIAAIWREVLNVERVGLYDNFFDLGGHSLALIRVHQALQTKLGRKITVLDLFKCPSVSLLAEALTQPEPKALTLERGQARQAALERQQRVGQQRRAHRLSKPEANHD